MANYHSSRAIVLGTVKYGDNSRIVRLYTDQFGLISVLLTSVKSKSAAMRASMLLPLSLVEIVHTHNGKGKLDRVKEAKMDLTYTKIPYDPVRNAIALFLAELFGKVLREEQSNAEKFDFIRSACLALDTLDQIPPSFHLAVWAKLTLYLGFSPNIEEAVPGTFFDLQDGQFLSHPSLLHPYLDQPTSEFLLQALQWDFYAPLSITKQGRNDLLDGLTRYMNIHLDGFGAFKSLEVLRVIF